MKKMEWDEKVWLALKDAVSGMPTMIRKRALEKIISKAEKKASLRGSVIVSEEDLLFAVELAVPAFVKPACKQALKESGLDIDSVKSLYNDALKEITKLVDRSKDRDETIRRCLEIIRARFKKYDWIGIYIRNGDNLILGPYIGKPTEHTVIPISEGICGSAVREGDTIIVNDVREDSRYIACSLETRSEIVVPIFKNGSPIAEIDIDSDALNAFKDDDRIFLEKVAEILANLF
ncbi:MAG: GAF domain-containing protein [bacterium]